MMTAPCREHVIIFTRAESWARGLDYDAIGSG
jgi:hypothetical protein